MNKKANNYNAFSAQQWAKKAMALEKERDMLKEELKNITGAFHVTEILDKEPEEYEKKVEYWKAVSRGIQLFADNNAELADQYKADADQYEADLEQTQLQVKKLEQELKEAHEQWDRLDEDVDDNVERANQAEQERDEIKGKVKALWEKLTKDSTISKLAIWQALDNIVNPKGENHGKGNQEANKTPKHSSRGKKEDTGEVQ